MDAIVFSMTSDSLGKWSERFLKLAEHISEWSRDPSTKVGAVITHNKRIISVGFNGFPKDVLDLPERYENRDTKLKMVVHGEANAMIFAKESLEGATLYTWPFMPCSSCAGLVIQAGIKTVYAPLNEAERWQESFKVTRSMFAEAGVRLIEVRYPEQSDNI